MKILRVKLSNLNSLRGEHTIDLAGEPLGSAGIFAITGPTGAGKSTILDAMTLALYGRAARYVGEANPEHMMSRHTGECAAEVLFEVPSGRYRAEWQLRKARGKSDGKLQQAKRYIYDSADVVLARQLREADRVVEELCGLDYDRFMRSVLLAQGEFARFLKANADDRASLLESLTGTVIYSELSALTHREVTRRHHELQAKEREMGLIELLSEEDRKGKEDAVSALAERRDTEKQVRNGLAETITRSEELQTQVRAEMGIRAEQAALKQGREDAAVDLARLARHRMAMPFLPDLHRVDDALAALQAGASARARAEELVAQAEEERRIGAHAAAAMAEDALAVQDEVIRKSKEQIGKLQGEKLAAEEWLQENARDQGLAEAFPKIVGSLTDLRALRAGLRTAAEESGNLDQELAGENRKLEVAREALKNARETLRGSVEDTRAAAKALDVLLAGREPAALQQQLDGLKERSHEIRNLQGLDGQRESALAKQKQAQQRAEELKALIQSGNDALRTAVSREAGAGELLRSYRDHLATAQKVASLEDHRAQLENGQPCPLCGAREHPYASGDEKPPEIGKLEALVAKAAAELENWNREVTACRIAVTKREAELQGMGEQICGSQEESGRIGALMAAKGAALGLKAAGGDPLSEALAVNERAAAELAGQLRRIDAARQVRATAEKTESAARNRVGMAEQAEAHCLGAIGGLRDRVRTQLGRVAALQTKVAEAADPVAELLDPFGVGLPGEGAEEAAKTALEARNRAYAAGREKLRTSAEAVQHARSLDEGAGKERQALGIIHARLVSKREAAGFGVQTLPVDRIQAMRAGWTGLEEAEQHLDDLGRTVERGEVTLKERTNAEAAAGAAAGKAREVLASRLEGSGFADAAALQAARLDPGEEQRLVQLQETLNDAEKNLGGRLQGVRESIHRLREQETAEGDALAALQVRRKESEDRLQEITERCANLIAEIRRDDANRSRQARQEAALRTERALMRTWDLLQALIGSHDGRKFRRFAQGISLDVLVRHANQHLARLTERYQLRRAPGQELDLEIVDLFQAGVSRPMSSLSGGESFLASLALALGLSDLAGRNVQIDSLFIDEGFGSLDPETLDVALSALEILRMHHKTVGVISHVDLLKERISTQIAVSKLPGGLSRLDILPRPGN